MALAPAGTDLSRMYGFRRTSAAVRDPAPVYGEGPDEDRFPADDVLADLARLGSPAPPIRAARILARYAALRHWLLRRAAGPAALEQHAASAAREYLAACGAAGPGAGEWREGALLLRLLQADRGGGAALLSAAATEAFRAGDRRGAEALSAAAVAAAKGGGGAAPPA